MKKQEAMSVWLALGIVLVLVAAFVGAFYLLVRTVGIEGSIIWSTLVAGIGWLISEHISRRREHQKLLGEKKREMYFEFLEFMLGFLVDVRENKEEAQATPDQLTEMTRWSLRLSMVGSDEVVRAWNDYRAIAGDEGGDVFTPIARLLSAMRKDCGHYGTTLTPLDMLAVIIKGEDLPKIEKLLNGEDVEV